MTSNPDDIGDFKENKVLEWTPISFTVEFIHQMRKNKKKLLNQPSTRQAVAIPKLLTAMYYRKNILIHEDFITAAVITTPIEDQKIARKIAYEILFPTKFVPNQNSKQKVGGKGQKNVPNDKKIQLDDIDDDGDELDFMDSLLSDISDAGLDLDDINSTDLLKDSLEELSSITDFIDDVYKKAYNGEDPFASLVNILEQRNGYSDLMSKSINTLTSLKELVYNTILREMNILSPSDIISATNLGWDKEIIKQSTAPWINISTQFYSNNSNFQNSLNDLVKNGDVGSIAKTAKYLKDIGMDEDLVEDLIKDLSKKANDLMDIHEISKCMDSIPNFDQKSIFINSLKKDVIQSFTITRDLDNQFQTDLTSDLFDEWLKSNPNPTISDLFQAQTDNQNWRDMLKNTINKKLQELKMNATSLMDLSTKLIQLSNMATFQSSSHSFQQAATKAGISSLKNSKSSEDFIDILKNLMASKVPLDENEVIMLGQQIGIPEETLLEIFGGNYELLKILCKNNNGNFSRYERILKRIGKLNQTQMNELMQICLQNNNYQAMGALGHQDLSMALKSAQQFNSKNNFGNAMKKAIESLTAGPGENLLLQWFYHRTNIPSSVKDFLRELTKNALVKIAMNMISNQRGSGEKGLIPTNSLRIFMDGDDMDLIDIDASIENIVMAGKSPELITSEDLLVYETEKGRVSICFLLDISGSMSGMKLAACSIAVMVLIGRLKVDEVAIALFESNTHVVKEFGDEKDLDSVADQLLDLHAMGGTQVQAAFSWGAKQLETCDSEMKLLFILTDCEFFEDKREVRKELDKFVLQQVKFILAVNTQSYRRDYADLMIDTTNGQIIKILNIPDIPKVISETLEKIG